MLEDRLDHILSIRKWMRVVDQSLLRDVGAQIEVQYFELTSVLLDDVMGMTQTGGIVWTETEGGEVGQRLDGLLALFATESEGLVVQLDVLYFVLAVEQAEGETLWHVQVGGPAWTIVSYV